MRGVLGRMRLWAKLALVFVLVVAVAIGSVALLTNRATAVAFRQYVGYGYAVRAESLALHLMEHYAITGSWEGAQQILATQSHMGPGRGQGQSGAGRFLLVDPGGRVVADSADEQVGQRVSDQGSALTIPIEVGGHRVGVLYVFYVAAYGPGNSGLGQQEQDFLDRVSRALLLGGGLAGVIAIILGIWFASQLVSPLRDLSIAAAKVAATDFSSRVRVRSEDEIGHLGQTFNHMAEALQRAEKARQQMSADIAHELRTPVTVIQGHLEALQDGVFAPSAENYQVLLDETALLSRLIEDLRDLSLAESGGLALSTEEVDPGALLSAAVQRFRSLAIERGVELTLSLPQNRSPLRADELRIQQVLANLLGNALRHTPSGGRIDVAAKWVSTPGDLSDAASVSPAVTRSLPYLQVSVSDTGEGIAPDHLLHVFDRFYRADPSRSRESGGSGLGLTIAQQIVRAHRGEMGVSSAVGRGTRFAFTLPAVASEFELGR